MVPKYLYHGSGKNIMSEYLKVNKPTDNSAQENCINGVYATDQKDIAIGMALATEKQTKSFADYSKKPFKIIFVRGEPKKKQVYLYKVSSEGFTEHPPSSHQWVCKNNVAIISKEVLITSKLSKSWRKATENEKKYYFSMKKIKK